LPPLSGSLPPLEAVLPLPSFEAELSFDPPSSLLVPLEAVLPLLLPLSSSLPLPLPLAV
jgi:hypothetical protein